MKVMHSNWLPERRNGIDYRVMEVHVLQESPSSTARPYIQRSYIQGTPEHKGFVRWLESRNQLEYELHRDGSEAMVPMLITYGDERNRIPIQGYLYYTC